MSGTSVIAQTNMAKLYTISGYWKDDGSEFENYLVTDIDSVPDGYSEEDIFFFGLSEKELQESSESDMQEFVITNYQQYHG